jgi:RimJ/RimL family protein N-acetyltransferase
VGSRIEIPASIAGGEVVLRPLAERDLDAYAAAFAAEPALGVAAGFESDPSAETLPGKPDRIAAAAAAGDWVELVIADPEDDRLLGSVTMHSYDWSHGHAEVGFWVIESERGRGVATAAVGTAVDWSFTEHDLHRFEMTTVPDLPHAPAVIALAERLGFVREGLMRERNLERGRRLDVLWLAVMRQDWRWPLRQEPSTLNR